MASLHFIYAPMNASKSAQLIMTAHNYKERKYKVLVVKPSIDTRTGKFVKSRALDARLEVDLSIFREDKNVIFQKTKEEKYDVVLVDEAQFLTKEQVDELSDIVDYLGVPVMAYGLKTDFSGNLFEGSKRLLEISDKFQEFKTICPCCGKKAIVNMRVDKNGKPIFEGEQVQVGYGYLPVCRKYYKELKTQFQVKEKNNE